MARWEQEEKEAAEELAKKNSKHYLQYKEDLKEADRKYDTKMTEIEKESQERLQKAGIKKK